MQKWLVAKNHFLLVAERSWSLQKVTFYLLQKEVGRCKKSLFTCCRKKLVVAKTHSLLVAKFSSCSLQKFTRYGLQNSLSAKNHSSIVAKLAFNSLQQITCYSIEKVIHHLVKQSQVHKVGGDRRHTPLPVHFFVEA